MTQTKEIPPNSLEINRVEELDNLLTQIQPLLISHIKSSQLGPQTDPKTLSQYFRDEYAVGDDAQKKHVIEVCQDILKYSVNTWSHGFLDKLYASTTPIGVISDLILSVLNTNSHVYTVSPVLTVLEKYIGHIYAKQFGWTDERSGGLTFSGGSWSNITSMHMARSIKFPETNKKGNYLQFAIFTSCHSHYSVEKAAVMLGLGSDSVYKVNVDHLGKMDVSHLKQCIVKAREAGKTPFYVNATAGTTVFGSFDPIDAIADVCEEESLWLHVDGSWGGNVIFSESNKNKLHGITRANSLTVNPHKMLGVPTTCSFLLVPDDRVFVQAMSLNGAAYLFHGNDNWDLANGTMGCGRRADALKLYLAWYYYGTNGFASRIDHAFTITQYFFQKLGQDPRFLVVNPDPQCFQVCFYYNKDSKFDDATVNTETTRTISRRLHGEGKFLVDYAPAPGIDKGEFFRVVFNSPMCSSTMCDELYTLITR